MTGGSQEPHRTPKLLVFGIDGGTFDVILPAIRQRHLPNLAELIGRGCCSTLTSTVPPLTPIAWPTMFCGRNAGQHGIFDFVTRVPNSYTDRITTAADRKTPAVWQLANQAGLSTAVLNVPFSFPPDETRSMVTCSLG